MSSRARCGGAAEVLEISRTTGAELAEVCSLDAVPGRGEPRRAVRFDLVPFVHGGQSVMDLARRNTRLVSGSSLEVVKTLIQVEPRSAPGARAGVISVLDRTGIVVFLALCLRPSPLHLSRQTRPAPRPGAGRRSYGATRAHTRHRGFSSRLRTSWLLRWCSTGCRATPRDVSQTARCVPRRSDTSMDR